MDLVTWRLAGPQGPLPRQRTTSKEGVLRAGDLVSPGMKFPSWLFSIMLSIF